MIRIGLPQQWSGRILEKKKDACAKVRKGVTTGREFLGDCPLEWLDCPLVNGR